MKPIEPMTIDEFFAKTAKVAEKDDRHLSLTIYALSIENGGGFRADALSGCAYGDTPGEAIRAAHDHATGAVSKRARMNPPFLTSDREAKRWDRRHRVSYDYRAKDWEPPK
jgi:hypothetical protein